MKISIGGYHEQKKWFGQSNSNIKETEFKSKF